MHHIKQFKSFNELPPEAKHVPLENMFNKLEEFQEHEETNTLTEEEEARMHRLENYIELRLSAELHLGKFINSESIFSENMTSNDICFKLNDEMFIEDFIPEYFFRACQRTPFFISKNTLNYNWPIALTINFYKFIKH